MNVLKDMGSAASLKQPLTRPIGLVVLFKFNACNDWRDAFEMLVGYTMGVRILGFKQRPTFLVLVHTL
jgi:hypothetical protein